MLAAREQLAKSCTGVDTRVCRALTITADHMIEAALTPGPALSFSTTWLTIANRSLNRSLDAAGLAYFVDTTAAEIDDTRVVLAMSFTIGDVRRYRAEGIEVSVLFAERLDRLNWNYDMLGFSAHGMDEAVVMTDLIDAELVRDTCFALALQSADQSPPQASWTLALKAELGEAWREVGSLCKRRRDAWDRVRHEVRMGSLYEVGEPRGLFLSEEELAIAKEALDADAFSALEKLESELAASAPLAQRRALERHRAAIHEAQHRIDLARNAHRAAEMDEASAYLAEMISAPESGRTSLARLTILADESALVERKAATLILTKLGANITPSSTPSDISRAARTAYRSILGREPAVLEERKPTH